MAPARETCPGCDSLKEVERFVRAELKEIGDSLTECVITLKTALNEFKSVVSEVKKMTDEINNLKIILAKKEGEEQAYKRLGITGAITGGSSLVGWLGDIFGWWGK